MKPYLIAALLFVMGLGVYGLDRGIYIGATTVVDEGILRKNCRYLFVTGIAETPAHGGAVDQNSALAARFVRGIQLADQPDSLYCRLFGE